MADGDGRDRACRESRRHQAGRTRAFRRTARRHLSRQGHQVERSCDRQAQSEGETADRRHHRGAPFGRFGNDLQLHRLSVEGQHRVEGQGRPGNRC